MAMTWELIKREEGIDLLEVEKKVRIEEGRHLILL
jgi:hypothetical protein